MSCLIPPRKQGDRVWLEAGRRVLPPRMHDSASRPLRLARTEF
jgi:hypothetical protein